MIKKELKTYSPFEILFYLGAVSITFFVSQFNEDLKIALVSALCGISYVFFAGKGKIYCYYFGITGTLCYTYISYLNGFWGNLLLYALYFLPMEIIGIFKWKKHLKGEDNTIKKTCLDFNKRIKYFLTAGIVWPIAALILYLTNGQNPLMDSFTVVFSILAQLLTLKRCYEQWHIWTVINGISMLMWFLAFLNGSKCAATVLMWGIYFIMAIYFMRTWKKELIS